MFVAWEPELSLLYNDAYAEILGAKHPASLGARFRDVWTEVWPDIAPLVDDSKEPVRLRAASGYLRLQTMKAKPQPERKKPASKT